MKITVDIGRWNYELWQDQSTGVLEVRGFSEKSLAQKVVEYAKAEASGLVGSVALPVLEARKAACDGCESCRKADDSTWYCKSCGCPEWERSRLQVKWELPGATCPLGKWPG